MFMNVLDKIIRKNRGDYFMVDCIKECSCCECENLMVNQPIVFVHQCGLMEKRETLVGFKCLLYGQCSETVSGLRGSDLMDDIIYVK